MYPRYHSSIVKQGQCSGQGNDSKSLTDTGYLDFCLWKYLLIHRFADLRKLIQVPCFSTNGTQNKRRTSKRSSREEKARSRRGKEA